LAGASTERTFLSARAEFEDVFSRAAVAKRNWQVVTFALLGLLGMVIGAYVRLASASRITPYVVALDRFGLAQPLGPADRMHPSDEQRVLKATLATFIHDVRAVTTDPVAEADIVRRAYAFVDQRGAAFLNDYFATPAHDPRVLGRQMTRLVEITSLLPVPGPSGAPAATWKVQWTETDIPADAATRGHTAAWEGYLTIRRHSPERAEVIAKNPLGIYVTGIAWTQIATVAAAPSF
jgi:type IV secretion system protein VirB5